MGCLYRLTFPSGKSYIGITSRTLQRRLSLHRSHATKGRPGAVYNAIRKYGSDGFAAEILVIADDWLYLCELERRAIAAFGTIAPGGYNLTEGGEGTPGRKVEGAQLENLREAARNRIHPGRPGGWKHTPESIEKIQDAGRGRIFTEERKAKIGASKVGNKYGLGKPCSAEKREKIAAPQRGRSFSSEHIKALSAAHQGKPWSEARRAAQKKKG